ncbi:hypothetical protein D3C84_1220880 [compost metagenome]
MTYEQPFTLALLAHSVEAPQVLEHCAYGTLLARFHQPASPTKARVTAQRGLVTLGRPSPAGLS